MTKLGEEVTSGMCRTGALSTAGYFRYRASAGCEVATSATVTGTVTLAEQKTLCCNFSF